MTDTAQSSSELSAFDGQPARHEHSRTGMSAEALRRAISDHLVYSIGRPAAAITTAHYYQALSWPSGTGCSSAGWPPPRTGWTCPTR